MSIAKNGMAFVKLSLEQDFKISDIVERANLTGLIIQLFNPAASGGHMEEERGAGRSELSPNDEELPAYEEK